MQPETPSTSEQQADRDTTREQDPQRAEWMAHAEKGDVEAILKMDNIIHALKLFQKLSDGQINKKKLAIDKRRRAGRKKVQAAGRRYDQKIRREESRDQV